MTSHLRNACIPLVQLRQAAADRLASILSEIDGPKALVLGPDLSGPLGMLVDVSLLKQNGVDAMYELGPHAIRCQHQDIVYVLRPDLPSITTLSEQVHAHRQEAPARHHHYHLVFVPRATLLCESALVQLGVYGNVTRYELCIELFPYDDDVVTMCLERCFRDLAVANDPTCLYSVACALVHFQELFGRIPRVLGKGDWAHRVAELMMKVQEEPSATPAKRSERVEPLVDELIIIDRRVDLVTPMLQQLNYEGLLDEIVGITNGFVEVEKPAAKDSSKAGRPAVMKLGLNSDDDLFRQIRNTNFNAIKHVLKRRAAHIQATYEERHAAESISQMSAFMKKFKAVQREHTSLQAHIGLAERVSDVTRTPAFLRHLQAQLGVLVGSGADAPAEADAYLEELVGKRAPIAQVLRFIVLMSTVLNGVKQKQFDFIRREIVQTYGFQHLLTLDSLERSGLFVKRESRSSWPSVRSALNLIGAPVSGGASDTAPKTMHFAFHGYAPITCRLVEGALQPGWSHGYMRDALAQLPGKTFAHTVDDQKRPAGAVQGAKKIVVVCFVGGVTFAEISVLRWLSGRQNHDREYVILTTHLSNGDQMVDSLAVALDNALTRHHPASATQ
ncbi:Vacuolar protein sorting-associated protein 33A [Plasmodiophora brassicae]|uniref:Vacuolar protein sorting-associated protein 33A n=1 Tax=Plasmodiophora brassicae TaxID=37360 RepID=A0A3P3Y507_PLABS|nr:unnamed protein product [Plasmodiophora brassicae]